MNILAKSTLALLLFCPIALGAQSRTAFAIGAGPSRPVGRLGETQSHGFDLTAGFIRGSDDSPFGLRFDFDYDRLPGKMRAGVKNRDRKVAGGTADVVFSMSGSMLKPYFLAGAGAFKMSSDSESDAKIRFGFDFGLGFTIPAGSKAFFIESRINSVSQHQAKPLRYVPIVFGFLF